MRVARCPSRHTQSLWGRGADSTILVGMVQQEVDGLAIGTAPEPQQAEALSLALAESPPDVRLPQVAATLASARRGRIGLDGLIAARRGERLVGAAWACLMPGRTALVSPPHIVAGEPEATLARLRDALAAYLESSGVRLGQVVLTERDGPTARRLVQDGYSHAAELLYMICPADALPAEQPAGELTFERYDASQSERMAQIIEHTYHETRDVPALNGVRDMADVLEGYRSTGDSADAHWFFVQHHREDVGCLLLADHPTDDQCELVYMGVMSPLRGRKWGLAITRFGQWQARRMNRPRMILAVDAANKPAVASYVAAEFVICDRRSVFLRVFSA